VDGLLGTKKLLGIGALTVRFHGMWEINRYALAKETLVKLQNGRHGIKRLLGNGALNVLFLGNLGIIHCATAIERRR